LANRVFLWDGTMHDLGDFGFDAPFISATGINDSGHMVGTVTTSTAQLAYRWDGTTALTLGTLPGGTYSRGFAINDAGHVVGESGALVSTNEHPFFWDGAMRDLGTLGGARGSARAINTSGLVVGDAETASGERHAFLWDGTTMRDLGTLGGAASAATGINDFGVVVGSSTTSSGDLHAFVWDGTMYDLGTLGGSESAALAINNAGQVVGYSLTAAGEQRATLWQKLTPVEQLQICSALVASLETAGVATSGHASSLLNKIRLATALLNQAKSIPALNVLEAFLNEVNALGHSGALTPGSASQLTACVQPAVDAVSN